MEQDLKVEVKTVSMETIKPSIPPHTHPKTFTLSLLDQINAIFNTPVLLFYTTAAPKPQGRVDISGLKTSLSETLDQFYPLAGRLLDEYTISCNGQGIPFIETEVNCHLSSVLTSPHKLKLLTKFLPPQEFQAPPGHQLICEVAPLVFQINVFLCGGMVIGCYMLHKVLDAASLGTFFRHWSALASKRFTDLVQPDFEATVKAFPPIPNVKNMSSPDIVLKIPPPQQSNTLNVIKSFIFDTAAVNELKVRAESEETPKPTRFEAVMGFIWEHMLATTHHLGVQVEQTTLLVAVNMRPRLSPPLPRESIGNLITKTKALAQVADNKSNCPHLQELVKVIHSALSYVNGRISNSIYQGQNGAEVYLSEWVEEVRSGMACEKGNFRVTSWCKMGFGEADFGLGKPVWIVPTDGTPLIKNLIILTDYCHLDGDGIEAWLFMEEKEMQYLESNPNFLAFASPN